ncbi:MAG: hypothetical protein M0Q53_00250 [Prolixibacteraceae bacterium]|jgi:hypothetical protein|nr:hypothetical protein [Prolixibacteraceae bacterium]
MLTAILVPLASFAMVFGIIYVIVTAKNRERMLLIEKGADPKLFESVKTPSSGGILKWGLFLVGIGMGIFCGSLLAGTGMNETAAYFSMICLFGGGGLLIAYRIEQKQINQKEKQ